MDSFKSKFDPPYTPHCAAPDSLQHRALHCPYYDRARLHHTCCVEHWDSVPVALSHHGWTPVNRALYAWSREHVHSWHVHPTSTHEHNLFSDGTCHWPTTPDASLAACAVVSSDAEAVVASDILPGVWQHNDRAELYAVCKAIC